MASFAFASRPPAVDSFGSRIRNAVASFFALLRSWNGARAESEMLSRLTDRQLDDIGVARGEIDKLAFNRARWH